MQRRILLKLIWMSALATLSTRTFGFGIQQNVQNDLSLLKSIYRPTPAMRAVGSRYLHSLDAQPSIGQLLKFAGIQDASTPRQLISAFEAQRKADFEANNIAILDGWIVARAEASICAILSQ
jgi:hypothetical protein